MIIFLFLVAPTYFASASMPDVSIIIINYNTFKLTSDCIHSVIRETRGVNYEIILVDNASTETNPEQFLGAFPSIHLIKSPVNGGFAAGNNLGISHGAGNYMLLLNSDTILAEDSVSKAVQHMKLNEKIGVLGCRMIFPDGRLQYTARRFRSISWELLDIFRFIPFVMPYSKRAKRMLGKYFRHDENTNCDWVNGAFFLFPRKVLEQLPGKKLNERFFMYGEDQLWCEQIKNLGYQILFYCETTIVHINSGSTEIGLQLKLRTKMLKHELEIMRLRKGTGFYYFFFQAIFVSKEKARNFLKWVYFKLTGKMSRR